MERRKAAIRADGSAKIGMGHIVRCVALARAMKDRGWEIVFFTRKGDTALRFVREEGFAVCALPPDSGSKGFRQALMRALVRFRPEVLINDILDTGKGYMKEVRKAVPLVINLDDAGEGSLFADGVINTFKYRRFGKRKGQPRVWQGVRYLILRPEFRSWGAKKREMRRKTEKVIITMGGSDTYGYTLKLVRALVPLFPQMRFHVITGPAFRFRDALREERRRMKFIPFSVKPCRDGIKSRAKARGTGFTVSNCPRRMASLFYRHDIAICSGGITAYEVAAVGTPALALANEEHEMVNIRRLSGRGAVINLGRGSRLRGDVLAKKLNDLAGDYGRRKAMSRAGRDYIDGKGLNRVMDIITRRRVAVETKERSERLT